MLDPDVTVQNRAFLIGEEILAPEYRDLALRVLATATNQWLFHAAFRIALAQGANYECAKIWAQRFDEKLARLSILVEYRVSARRKALIFRGRSAKGLHYIGQRAHRVFAPR